MDTQTLTSRRRQKVWLDQESGKIDAFKELVAQTPNPHEWPLASGVVKNVLIYDGSGCAPLPATRMLGLN